MAAVCLRAGFGPANGPPSNLLRALVKQGTKSLPLAANTPGMGRAPEGSKPFRKTPPNYDDGGILIQSGQVKKAICAFPGMARPGMRAPLFEKWQAGGMGREKVPTRKLGEK